ncbi:hypothetical protein [Actinophytocola algeriensis]|uniref:Uncharacterized protein n=1 Tax=Actinophytocola algeriensis TaxID=1768010 RepID=A0A7W7Q068_9PSEU|nr:hypothetical protein [Actinophytocola algeriensis]MBB4904570.1 hypothetical protein [Actinophytocola algeriensis]MBE1476571.1 hypothetical protein [Actinophytocola algeriensis]
MDIEKLIKDTFTAHEHDVPDDDTVLAAAQQRIDRRRTVSRPLAVAAGVAALTLAAVTVVALNRSAPADNVAAPADEVQAEPAIADLRMPFSLGWLPPGSVDYRVQRVNVVATQDDPDTPLYGGEYMLTVTANGQNLNVNVQHFPMASVDEVAVRSRPGNPVTINGQRGVESSDAGGPGGYELYVPHPDGGAMYVHVLTEFPYTAPAQQLVDVGRRVAQNLRYPGNTTVTPSFGLRDLPGGMRICAFDVGKPFDPSPLGSALSTGYELGTCTTMPPIRLSTANAPRGDPGQPTQGHPTRYVNENGHHSLWVLDAVNDAPILIAGSVPLTDLYDIANRLVLPR